MIKHEDVMAFSTPEQEWMITLPEGAKYPRVLEIYDMDGHPRLEAWNPSQSIQDGKIKIRFGFDSKAGEVLYEWRMEGDSPDDHVYELDGNSVTINITQNSAGGDTDEVTTFPE